LTFHPTKDDVTDRLRSRIFILELHDPLVFEEIIEHVLALENDCVLIVVLDIDHITMLCGVSFANPFRDGSPIDSFRSSFRGGWFPASREGAENLH
jgi:hypothetical protein